VAKSRKFSYKTIRCRSMLFVCSDISRGQEQNPIQCVNVEDDEEEPTDFVYVSENCFTSNINVDRTITSLQSCKCSDMCSTVSCHCGNISLRCWYDDQGRLLPDFNYAGVYFSYCAQKFIIQIFQCV
jgi:euchromatic histone-lysine N-methyltransferase